MVRSNKPIHPLPSTEHPLCHQLSTSSPPTIKNTPSATNSPPLLHQPSRTPKNTPSATNSPPLLHQPSRTPKNTQEEGQEKEAHDEQAAGERQGRDELKHKIFFQTNPLLCSSCSLKFSVKNSQASSSVFSCNLCYLKWIMH
jgi:hypothetical protein